MGAKLPWVEVGVRFPERIAGPCPQRSILTFQRVVGDHGAVYSSGRLSLAEIEYPKYQREPSRH